MSRLSRTAYFGGDGLAPAFRGGFVDLRLIADIKTMHMVRNGSSALPYRDTAISNASTFGHSW